MISWVNLILLLAVNHYLTKFPANKLWNSYQRNSKTHDDIKAVDHAGLQSERRCITYTTAEKFFINIDQMGRAILKGDQGTFISRPFSFSKLFLGTFRYREAENYGCAGRGLFNPFSRTIGKQVDEADRDIFKWKKCVQCANGFNSLPEYKFWVNNATCSKFQFLFHWPHRLVYMAHRTAVSTWWPRTRSWYTE